MSWCDKLASTPIVGLKLNPHVMSASSILDAASPLLSDWNSGQKTGFTLDQQDAFSVQFTSESGFRYAIDPIRVSVGFHHRMRMIQVSAGPPTMEMLTHARPYTELLKECSARLIDMALMLPDIKDRYVQRVGVMSLTAVAEEDLPPGFVRFARHVSRPFHTVEGYSVTINAALEETEHWRDTCILTIAKPTDNADLMNLQLDFGREYNSAQTVSPEVLKRVAGATEEAALAYFETLAEGSQFDEDLVSHAVAV